MYRVQLVLLCSSVHPFPRYHSWINTADSWLLAERGSLAVEKWSLLVALSWSNFWSVHFPFVHCVTVVATGFYSRSHIQPPLMTRSSGSLLLMESSAREARQCKGGHLDQHSELKSNTSDKWPLLLVSLDLDVKEQVWFSAQEAEWFICELKSVRDIHLPVNFPLSSLVRHLICFGYLNLTVFSSQSQQGRVSFRHNK